jgi:hypothetical protein
MIIACKSDEGSIEDAALSRNSLLSPIDSNRICRKVLVGLIVCKKMISLFLSSCFSHGYIKDVSPRFWPRSVIDNQGLLWLRIDRDLNA